MEGTKTSERAIDRGYNQIGTLGSGNHYLEVQVARPEDVRDNELAAKFGITIPNQVVVMFHCGSRGFGHQVATDHLQIFLKVMETKYGIKVLDRELACAPFESTEKRENCSCIAKAQRARSGRATRKCPRAIAKLASR